MERVIVAAFVATFIAAIAAVVGMPVLAQNASTETPTMVSPALNEAPTATTPEGARAKFAAMDTDHDGKVSKAEWLAAGRHERGFAIMDADHDGFVTMVEIKVGREKMEAMRETKGKI